MNAGPTKGDELAPHQLMTSGLERFVKCYVFLIHHRRHRSYPDNEYVRCLGRNLKKLLFVGDDNNDMLRIRELGTAKENGPATSGGAT